METKKMTIKIIIADDHPVTRKGLSSILSEEKDLKVLCETGDGRSTIEAVQKRRPDVIIMDITLPDIDGIQVTRTLKRELPDIKILALSIHSNKHYILEMLKAGASGYLLKDCDVEEVVRAVHFIMSDQIYLSTENASLFVKEYISVIDRKGSIEKELLSPREYEVLENVASGRTTKEIAEILNISKKTVESHRFRIMQKLDIHSIAELTLYAQKTGLVIS